MIRILSKSIILPILLIIALLAPVAEASRSDFFSAVEKKASAPAFPLAAGADLQKRPITTEAEAIERALELFPDLLKGKERQLKSNDLSPWHIYWEDPNVTEGISSISLGLEPETGWLRFFQCKEIRPESKMVWISLNQAEKMAYEFACRYYPEKMANTLPESTAVVAERRAMETKLDLRESTFSWRQAVNGIPIDDHGMTVRVDRSLGTVTSSFHDWKEDTSSLPQGQPLDKKAFTNQLIDSLGVYPCYTIMEDPYDVDDISREAKLVYRLNTDHLFFDAVTGQPIDNYHFQLHRVSPEEGRLFANPPFQTAGQKTGAPKAAKSKKITTAQGRKTAAGFFAKIGAKGVIQLDNPGEGSRFLFSIFDKKTGNQAWLEISPQTGEILRYDAKEIHGGEVISREQAEKTASAFFEKVRPMEGFVQTQPQMVQHGESFENTFKYLVEWYPLINGVPFEHAGYRVFVSKTGQVLSFYYEDEEVSSFESPDNMMLPHEAVSSLKNANLFDLSYHDFNYYPSDELMALVFRWNNVCISAQTGQMIQQY